jgi:hypothetical protein
VIHAISLIDSSIGTRLQPKAALEHTSRGGLKIGAILEVGISPSAFPLYRGGAAQRQAGRRFFIFVSSPFIPAFRVHLPRTLTPTERIQNNFNKKE